MSRSLPLRTFVFLVSGLAAACSGDDEPTTAPPAADAANTDGTTAEADASGSSSDVDASLTGDVGDSSSASETPDTSVTADAATSADAEAGAPDAKDGATDASSANDSGDAASDAAEEVSSESGSDSASDALDETALDGASDAPLDVDISSGTVLLLGGGASTVFTGEFHPGSPWIGSTLIGSTNDRPAVALGSASSGIGVMRSSSSGGELRFTSWSPGRFGAFAAIGNGASAIGSPALAASATRFDLAYHASDLKHYFARYVGSWGPTAEPIGADVTQSYGPTSASITLLGGDTVVAFADNSGLPADRSRVGGTWQGAHIHDLGDAGDIVTVAPTIVAPASGPELLVAFVRSPDQDVFFATRTSGIWSAPKAVAGAYTADPVALLALAGGDVILVFRSIDSHGYWVRYSGGVWSSVRGFPWFDIAVPSTPSLAPGINGVDAEMAFVDSANGSALHARLQGNIWGAPDTVGGAGLTSVSIASSP